MKNIKTQEMYLESKCIVNTIGPMLIELIKNTGGVQAAIETQRNENTARQDKFLETVKERMLT